MENVVEYFRNWHFITTYHLDQNTGYGQLFLTHRKQVLFIMSNFIKNSIDKSNKFISLDYKTKLHLV